ncbi:MAG TPA: hypothetical protein ENI57_00125 [Ignavibacteria bacterium]|nr:hypothetical protein [Ignavibacteria bacterium]
MNDNSVINKLFAHMQWADSQIWNTIEKDSDMKENEDLKKLLYHIHIVQFVFLQIWKKEKFEYPKVEEFDNLEALKNWSIENNKNINDFLDNASDEKINEIANVPWSKNYAEKIGKDVEQITIKESMLQVISHSTHHRAQINKKLKELGCAPPMVDFIVWLWEGKPHIL